MPQIVCDSELKRGRYGHLNQSCIEGMLLQDRIWVQFFLLVWAHISGHFVGLKVYELWQIYRTFFWQVLMLNISVKSKTNGFGLQLENCEKYPLAMEILRVDILLKFFLKINLMEILNFLCWYSPITLGFQLGNKCFWKFSK